MDPFLEVLKVKIIYRSVFGGQLSHVVAVDSKKWLEHGFRVISAVVPSFFGLGLEDGRV